MANDQSNHSDSGHLDDWFGDDLVAEGEVFERVKQRIVILKNE